MRGAGRPLTPGEVRERLAAGHAGAPPAELSYSTVVTIVSRLHAKGLLARERARRGFAYAPIDEASLVAGRMTQALSSGTDRDAVLSRFVSGLSGRDARLLRQLLDPGAGPPAAETAAGDPE
jgi:predicted transcriptional regulator